MAQTPDLSHPVLVHFYRAVVSHMDVWRQRMDATTNWAAATTAAMVTFTFSSVETPHFVLLLALAFDFMFLLMESRRYQIFDLWRRRFRVLNRYYVTPALEGRDAVSDEGAEAMSRIGVDLGTLVPHLTLLEAAGYRIRRNYGYLFTVAFVAWLLKLEVHPDSAEDWGEMLRRASIGDIPGGAVALAVLASILGCAVLALRAPSERMLNWADVPSPFGRWLRGRGGRDAAGGGPPPAGPAG
jgi:uncharacterized membrane protein